MKSVLSTITEKLDSINDVLHQILTQQTKKDTENQNTLESLSETVLKIQNDISESMELRKNVFNQRKTFQLRKEIIKTWKGHLNKRRQLFWHGLNCENTSLIYETWLTQEKKILPKKFLLKHIANEYIEEREIRQNTAFEKFQAEINLLKIRATRHQNKVRQIDEEMNTFLESNFTGNAQLNLKEQWLEEIQNEENKSLKRWASKQIWMENYEKDFEKDNFMKPKKRKSPNRNRQHQTTAKPRQHFQPRMAAKRANTPSTSTQPTQNSESERRQQNTRQNHTRNSPNNTNATRNTTTTTQMKQPWSHRRTYANVVRDHQPNPHQETRVNSDNYPSQHSKNKRAQNHFLGPHPSRNHPPNLRKINYRHQHQHYLEQSYQQNRHLQRLQGQIRK